MNDRSRLDPKVRKAQMLDCAMAVAAKVGWRRMTRKDIATACHTSDALVTARLGTMEAIRRLVMREAVKRGDTAVLVQGLAERDRGAMRAPEALKAAARLAL